MGVTFDTTDFDKGMKRFELNFEKATDKGLHDVANETLRLSQFEVPHDTGALQNTGAVVPERKEYLVGYNKVYAARLHEHPEYRFQKNRKGKYLEDPIKNNLAKFRKFIMEDLRGAFA